MKGTFSIFIRLLGTFLLFAFILSKVDLHKVMAHLHTIPFYLLFLIFAWNTLCQLIGVYRWDVILRSHEIRLSFPHLCVVTLKSMFFNMILPTAMGGDVIRGYALYKNPEKRREGVASVLVDRMVGLTAMVGIALFSVLWGSRYLEETPFTFYILAFAVLYFFVLALLATSFLKKITQKVFSIVKLKTLSEKVMSLLDALYSYLSFRRTMGYALFLSFVLQVGVIFTYFFVAKVMDVHMSLFHLFLFMPVVWIISMLPVSLGGLGLREGAFIFLFSKVGIPKEACLSMSFVATGAMMLLGLVGGLCMLVPEK